MNTSELATQYAQMAQQKAKLEEEILALKPKLAKLEEELLDQYGYEGVRSIKTAHGTVYLQRALYAHCHNVSALAETEWSWLVKPTVNRNSLSAHVREHQPEDPLVLPILPEEVNAYVTVSEVYYIKVRK